MLHFDAAPPIPTSYKRLSALNSSELAEAVRRGYVAENPHPSADVSRQGLDSSQTGVTQHDVQDWRARIYAIWFCYLYEHLKEIRRPLYAIEELFLEFQTNLLNGGRALPGLAQLYAGAGGWQNPTAAELDQHLQRLRVYYDTALGLLESYERGKH